MEYKKHNWMQYGRKGEIVEITVKDQTGRKLDFFRCNSKKDYARIMKIMKDSYGFKNEIDVDESPNLNEEMGWLIKHKEEVEAGKTDWLKKASQ